MAETTAVVLRAGADAVIAYGLHTVMAALDDPSNALLALTVGDGPLNRRQQRVVERAEARGCAIERVPRATLDELADGVHQGVVLRLEPRETTTEVNLAELLAADRPQLTLLLLDGVTDPRNLGASVRSAAAFGVDAVLTPSRRSAGLSPAALKAASGGLSRTPLVQITNLARALRQIQEAGVWTVGLAGEATRALHEVDLTGRTALIMGSEAAGLRRLTREHCDHVARLPTDGAASLNVAVAAGVALYELARQRGAGA